MATVEIRWQMAEDQALVVSVEADAEHPDALDQIAHRAVYLLHETLAAVEPKEETP